MATAAVPKMAAKMVPVGKLLNPNFGEPFQTINMVKIAKATKTKTGPNNIECLNCLLESLMSKTKNFEIRKTMVAKQPAKIGAMNHEAMI